MTEKISDKKVPKLVPQVVLVNPEIPQNTGNIARTTAALNTSLHLIRPLGFEITDKRVKRAGLDYWSETDVRFYDSWEQFLEKTKAQKLWFFTTKANKVYSKVNYTSDDYLVFGSETKGLAQSFHERYPDSRLKIPLDNQNIRSINLATAVAIALYCARAQID